ncbi:uncharacterized protein K02A2.6-like [Mercenaria mercenaria]|uniref:uncharacterized protein K02A2.6-like n=1 Tax=Mercenaria mercenaria TaxID=6596 RepID=UPI00234E85B1|nr:uncharacterized protein K02A2.6-like [Mercenaria mercenaria]
MLWVGEKGRDIYSTWTLSNDDKKKLEPHLTKLEEYCEPKSNVIYSRYLLKSRVQKQDETFEQFVTDLKLLIRDCGYPEDRYDETVRDHIVFGVKSHKIRESLIRKGSDLKLQDCLDIARTHEISQTQVKEMESEDKSLHGIKRKPPVSKKKSFQPKQSGAKYFQPRICLKCGYQHTTATCPANGKTCRKCKKPGHFEKMCKSKSQRKSRYGKVHMMDDFSESDSDTSGEFEYMGISTSDKSVNSVTHDMTVQVRVNGICIPMQLDTGAKCNVMSVKILKKLGIKGNIKNTRVNLKSYSGHTMKPIGTLSLPCIINDSSHEIKFHIIHEKAPTVLGVESCIALGLVKRVYGVQDETKQNANVRNEFVEDKFPNLFKGIGCLPKKHHIEIEKDAKPVVNPPRNVPVKLRSRVKDELDRMFEEGIIIKENEPTDWVNNMVTVVKPNGSLRICLDPSDLNKCIKRPHYPLKTIEDVVTRIPNAKVFSKLDCVSSFWQVELDEESSKLCTFNSCFGKFRFLRMPFGIKSASEVFQNVISEILDDIDGVEVIMDDILVTGTNTEEHDQRLKEVLQRLEDNNLKLSKDKCDIRKNSVSYVGHTLTSDGLKPDPEKIRAVLDMKPPQNKQQVKTFIGFIQYLSKFLPMLSEKTEILRRILKKDVIFYWGQQEDECLNDDYQYTCVSILRPEARRYVAMR